MFSKTNRAAVAAWEGRLKRFLTRHKMSGGGLFALIIFVVLFGRLPDVLLHSSNSHGSLYHISFSR